MGHVIMCLAQRTIFKAVFFFLRRVFTYEIAFELKINTKTNSHETPSDNRSRISSAHLGTRAPGFKPCWRCFCDFPAIRLTLQVTVVIRPVRLHLWNFLST